MFIALVLFAAPGDPVERVLKPRLPSCKAPAEWKCPAASAEHEATAL
jgi:hypothetical protein